MPSAFTAHAASEGHLRQLVTVASRPRIREGQSGSTATATLGAAVAPAFCSTVAYPVGYTFTPSVTGSGATFALTVGMDDVVAAVTNPNGTAASDEALLAVVSPADAANGGGSIKWIHQRHGHLQARPPLAE